MIQHSDYEKEQIKRAKKVFKKEHQSEQIRRENWLKEQELIKQQIKDVVFNGILEDEEILDDTFPIYYDNYYIIDDEGGRLITSDIQGTVLTLKNDLRGMGFKAENVRRCNMRMRNLLF